jgi:hypothetical protein
VHSAAGNPPTNTLVTTLVGSAYGMYAHGQGCAPMRAQKVLERYHTKKQNSAPGIRTTSWVLQNDEYPSTLSPALPIQGNHNRT